MLLFCPHCGGKAEIIGSRRMLSKTVSYNVVCLDCGATFSTDCADKESAVKRWNLRAGLGRKLLVTCDSCFYIEYCDVWRCRGGEICTSYVKKETEGNADE